MTVQTDLRPNALAGVRSRSTKTRHLILWPLLLVVALGLAAVAGVLVTARLTSPPAPLPVVAQQPNANEREGRISEFAARAPNANEREGRVAQTVAREANANERESRVPVGR